MHTVTVWNAAQAILYENPDQSRVERAHTRRAQGHPLTWQRYHRYADIVRFLEHTERTHPDTVELLHVGRSFEGRPLTVVRIAAPPPPPPSQHRQHSGRMSRRHRSPAAKRAAVFIEAGAHGREWIAPAAATWIVRQLVAAIGANDTLGESLRLVDWYVLPVLNPDGYEYAHQYDRFWAKTRSKHAPGAGDSESLVAMA